MKTADDINFQPSQDSIPKPDTGEEHFSLTADTESCPHSPISVTRTDDRSSAHSKSPLSSTAPEPGSQSPTHENGSQNTSKIPKPETKKASGKRPRENSQVIYTAIVTPRFPKYHTVINVSNIQLNTPGPESQSHNSNSDIIPHDHNNSSTSNNHSTNANTNANTSSIVSAPRRLLFTQETFLQHTYTFSFTNQQRLQALSLIFSFNGKLGPSLAMYLQSCALGPGQADFDAVWCDQDDSMMLVGVLDCDVTNDSLVGNYRAKVAERLDDGYEATGKLASASLMSEKKFEVPLLHLFPVKEAKLRWERLAECLDHVRFFCANINSQRASHMFNSDSDCATVLPSVKAMLF